MSEQLYHRLPCPESEPHGAHLVGGGVGYCGTCHGTGTIYKPVPEPDIALVTAVHALLAVLPAACSCAEAYRVRNLIAPDCNYHDIEGEIADVKRAMGEELRP